MIALWSGPRIQSKISPLRDGTLRGWTLFQRRGPSLLLGISAREIITQGMDGNYSLPWVLADEFIYPEKDLRCNFNIFEGLFNTGTKRRCS